MQEKFEIILLDEAKEFIENLDVKIRKKVIYNLEKSKYSNDPKLFKKLIRDVWEFRTRYGGQQYRLFAFWDKTDKKDVLVVATHGIVKKVSKVPAAEINKVEKLIRSYFDQD